MFLFPDQRPSLRAVRLGLKQELETEATKEDSLPAQSLVPRLMFS